MKPKFVVLFPLLYPCGVRGQTVPAASTSDTLDKLANDLWSWRAKYAPFTGDDVNRLERPGGVRDWSAAAIDKRGRDLKELDARYQKIDSSGWPIPQQVDYRLIGSALSRVHWELEINPRWKRDPNFYIEQTLTPIVEALTVPAPYDEERSREILTRIENVPSILQQGTENLDKAPEPFVTVAIQALEGVRDRLHKMATSLRPATTLQEKELGAATDRAADALDSFRTGLQDRLSSAPKETALGRDAYIFFLKNVAIYPYSPEQILAMGQQEWNRAVAFETYEKERNKNVPPLQLAKDTDKWIKDAAAKELQIREFLEKRGILTVPAWLQHYTLRPLRVEVDGQRALGQFSLEEAATYLEQKVPMDAQAARQEAIAFSTGPGQALTYQIRKLQIMQLLAEARLQQGEKFNLRAFHDFVWQNGNVPIALQRWEYLGAEEPGK